ncbi:hypothetical protein [Roseibium aggregatum]|jgi:hypothetical protein|uniref:Uncharacterized protein n=1 Tax=Roseibium aggregatum (strain ATCC 25650 / DSM 13394 / JCM 20685 / NBRC 16684 / NCIMB 2208 / IAM 12614 / B1) TaxID=384765 RepID=A0NY62_ROSAI|nr:hypothetical protein [Roseibium aggregatum]EAV42406.1 hypothetical protein SIAM614_22532 [Stappia aggregata IAM 12614] [Roseibium aggregatum IAM 12614]
MKTMLIAFAAIIVIAIGANQVLEHLRFSSADFTSSSSVRLGE